MFFTVNKKNNDLKIYEETDLKTLKISERNDMERWVIEKPEILGEELYILTNEYDKFDKTSERLDVLAIDKEGNLVVIELKRDDSGKNVELQAIKYAAYCSTLTVEEIVKLHKEYLTKKGEILSYDEVKNKIEEFVDSDLDTISDRPRIILVSREFRPEVTATVLWLRKFGIDISCVKFTVYDLNENEIAITSSVLIPLPEAEEYIIRAEQKEINEIENAQKNKLKIDFLEKIKTKIINELSIEESATHLSYKYNYLQLKTQQPGVHFEYLFRKKNWLEIGLHFEKNNSETNNQQVEKLKASLQTTLNDKLNEEVIFQTDWNSKKWAKIFFLNTSGVIDEQLEKWAIDKMKIFYEILKNELTS
jgi:hypothetical protein